MNKIMITLAAAAVLVITGCATTEITDQPVPEEKAMVQKAEKADSVQEKTQEKTKVKKTVFIPYTVRETNFYSDGFIESYKVFTYDQNMNLVREDLFDSFDEIMESQVYVIAPDGTVERRLFDERGQLQSWSKIRENEASQPVRIEFLDSEDELQTVSEFEYDSAGNKTDWTVYNGDGGVLSRTKYLYKGNLNTRIDIFDAAEELKEFFILEYEQDKLKNRSHYDEDEHIKASTEYIYDDAGSLVEVIYLGANGSVQSKEECINDERGNPVKIEYYDGEGVLKDLVERDYEYKSEDIFVREQD